MTLFLNYDPLSEILNYSDYTQYQSTCYDGEDESFKIGTDLVSVLSYATP